MRRIGLIFKKLGSSALFDDKGNRLHITLLQMESAQVIRSMPSENDTEGGYVEVGFVDTKLKHITKPMAGQFKKQSLPLKRKLMSFKVSKECMLPVAAIPAIDHFVVGQFVDVSGVSIGKGFAGTMKRHNFSGLAASHGVSASHRSQGSTGSCQDPGRVMKGKKMAGQMGRESVTMQNLEVVLVDKEKGLLAVKGAVPGYRGGHVLVKDAIKKSSHFAQLPLPAGLLNEEKVDA